MHDVKLQCNVTGEFPTPLQQLIYQLLPPRLHLHADMSETSSDAGRLFCVNSRRCASTVTSTIAKSIRLLAARRAQLIQRTPDAQQYVD
jgi:hypothetical protein